MCAWAARTLSTGDALTDGNPEITCLLRERERVDSPVAT